MTIPVPETPLSLEITVLDPGIVEIQSAANPNFEIGIPGGGGSGTPGADGTPGSKWYQGSGAPSNGMGIVGDWYINTANSDVYEKTGASAWTLRLNIKGSAGTNGTNGAAGSKWLQGTTVPDNGSGVVGDWYIRTTTADVYEKTGVSTWTLRANIKGVDGTDGVQGEQGLNGQDAPGLTASIDALIATNPFYIAHRGGGDVYPEHTMEAYEAAVAYGAKAIEVSVCLTGDGQLVCNHDVDTLRTTGVAGNIIDKTYATIKNTNKVDVSNLLGPNWPKVELPLLRDVLDRFIGRVVIFLEAKTTATITAVQNYLLDNYPDFQNYVVWKSHYTSSSLTWAYGIGMRVWAYIDPTTTSGQMDTVDASVDYWGVPINATDAKVTEVVARGKPVIVWAVGRRSEKDRLVALGVKGLMSSGFHYISKTAAPMFTRDTFSSGVRAPGDFSRQQDSVAQQPKWDLTNGSMKFDGAAGQAMVIGSFGPITATSYTIEFEMMYETLPSDTTLHAGVAFGKVSDDPYLFGGSNASGGYHILFRVGGQMQLYTHAALTGSGTQLATVNTPVPAPDQWIKIRIAVTPTQVTLTRIDAAATPATHTFTVTNNSFRGGYFHLSKHNAPGTVHFRNVIRTV